MIKDLEIKISKFPEILIYDINKMFSEMEVCLEEKKNILAVIKSKLKKNIFESQVEYAIRLMESSGKLEYEEIHKLFSLFDIIESFITLDFSIEKEQLDRYINLQKEFVFRKESKRCRLVSQDKVENWKKKWWWYQLNDKGTDLVDVVFEPFKRA